MLSLQDKEQLYVAEMSFKDRLKEARTSRKPKVTQLALAELLGVTPQAVSGWERGEAVPEIDKLTKIAKLLDRTVDWLLGDEASQSTVVHEVIPAPEFDDPRSRLGAATLPVLGVTMGGRDDERGPDFWMNGDVVNYVARPRKLEGRKDVFGLYVDGESMIPRYRSRDLVVVEKANPAPGDDVVIELKPLRGDDDPDNPSFIKEFVARRGSYITVRQFNPPKEIDFDLKEIKNLFRVIPLKELMG